MSSPALFAHRGSGRVDVSHRLTGLRVVDGKRDTGRISARLQGWRGRTRRERRSATGEGRQRQRDDHSLADMGVHDTAHIFSNGDSQLLGGSLQERELWIGERDGVFSHGEAEYTYRCTRPQAKGQ